MAHQPPKDVQEAAQRAEWIEDGKAGKGFTDVGRTVPRSWPRATRSATRS